MSKHFPVASVLSLTIAALLAGCGGSSDSSSQPTTKTLAVKAVDGYLKNARVWLDVNGNGVLDSDEPTASSDASGTATLDVTSIAQPERYRVLVEAIAGTTTDVGDGSATPTAISKSYVMSAPAGVTTVTPLTTLVEQSMSAGGLSQAAAVADVASRLGLSANDSAALLDDFIASKQTTAQVYASNLVQVLGSTLDSSKASALLTSGEAVGQALGNYLASNPVISSSDAAAVKVVFDSSGAVSGVIKDSNGDGQDDAGAGSGNSGDSGNSGSGGSTTGDNLATFVSASDALYLLSDNGDNSLWGDHWKSAGSGAYSWVESEIFAHPGLYAADASMNETSYLLEESGWVAIKDSDDIHITTSTDGSIAVVNAGGVNGGTMSGQCQDISGKTQQSLLSQISSETLPVTASATFSTGAEGCIADFTAANDTHYYIHNWTDGQNAVYVGNQQATTLDALFSSTAPVADSNAMVSSFSNGIPVYKQDTNNSRLMLVLVRTNSSDTSGVGQLWQYNDQVGGYQLLSNITPADHQGWSLVTRGSAQVVVLSDTIRNWLSGGDVVGYTAWQDRVQVVDMNDGMQNSKMLLLNAVGYQDLMAGRQLDANNDGVADNASSGSSDDTTGSDNSGSNNSGTDTGTTDSAAAAAAYVALINSQATVYSLYDEHGALGIAKITGENWQSYTLDFTTATVSTDDAGVSPLTILPNNHIAIADGTETSDTVCTEVRDLAGSSIATLLQGVTSSSQLSAMQALFGSAVFSSGAKAYINQHTDSEGTGIEIVLNETAYSDVLKAVAAAKS